MPNSKKISELYDVGTLGQSDLFEVSHNEADGFSSRSTSLSAVALAIANAINYEDLESTSKTILGAINEIVHNTQYHVGEEVSLYRCILSGFVTGSMKSLRFMIPLSKGFDEITIENNKLINTVISGNFEIRTVGGKYIISGDSLQSLGTVNIYKNTIGLMVEVVGESEFTNAVNNTPVILYAGSTAKITFN